MQKIQKTDTISSESIKGGLGYMTTTTTVKSDIEIAQEASMKKIQEIAADLNILEDELEPYGHYKGKLSLDIFKRLQDEEDGKVVLVTAINPTPAGEGKSTVTVGLGQAFNKIGKKTVIALREPSRTNDGIKRRSSRWRFFTSRTNGRH